MKGNGARLQLRNVLPGFQFSSTHRYKTSLVTFKPSSRTSVTIAELKIKKIIGLVSVELPVKHSTQCPTDIPDNH